MQVKYVGSYDGYSPVANRVVARGDVFEVDDSIGQQLVASGQFEEVKEVSTKIDVVFKKRVEVETLEEEVK